MKKILFIGIIGLIISVTTFAATIVSNYYISTTGQMTNCKRITFKANEIKVVLENGQKLLIPMAQIKTIKANGKIYNKLPVYKNNKPMNKEVFMELITTKETFKLYKYNVDIDWDKRANGFNVADNQMENYVVYKDNQFQSEINDANYRAMFNFFGINYREKY